MSTVCRTYRVLAERERLALQMEQRRLAQIQESRSRIVTAMGTDQIATEKEFERWPSSSAELRDFGPFAALARSVRTEREAKVRQADEECTHARERLLAIFRSRKRFQTLGDHALERHRSVVQEREIAASRELALIRRYADGHADREADR